MVDVAHFFHFLLFEIGEVAVIAFELCALIIIIVAGIKALYHLLSGKKERVALDLLRGFALGLSFLLGGEILKTVFMEDMKDILMVGGVVIMRVSLTVLIHWEMHQEEAELKHEGNAKKVEFANTVLDKAQEVIEKKIDETDCDQ